MEVLIDKFSDGKGNLAELYEHLSDRILVAKLLQPGLSRSEIVASDDNKVVMLRNNGWDPDTLYSYFEGDYDKVIQWLNGQGFDTKRRAQSRSPYCVTYVAVDMSAADPTVIGVFTDAVDPWCDGYRDCATDLDVERAYESIVNNANEGIAGKRKEMRKVLKVSQIVSNNANIKQA